MKLLIVNPNSSEVVTQAILESARRAASPKSELIAVTPKAGPRNIDSAYGDYMAGHHMLSAVRDAVRAHRPDAIVLAGFGNVGISALKEIMDVPVVSISEASMAMACLLGHRFSTLTMLRQFIPYQQDLVRLYGFEAKCASVRAININVEECVTNREEGLRQLKAQVETLVREDGAEVVILACAGLCGYDEALTQMAGVPVLDPVAVAVKVAESFVALGLCHSKVRKFHPPPQDLAAYE